MELRSADSFTIDGKRLKSFHAIEGLNPRTLQGEIVTVDGQRCRVLSVETFAVVEPINMPFSLYCEPINSDSN